MKIAAVEKVPLDINPTDTSPAGKSPGGKSPAGKSPIEKFNVAWFKLAEFVGRKEKERALGVYRLLSHSLPDDAFAAQLEGDLLMAFYDEKAVEVYQKAARLYEKNGQYDQAALLYEQMLMIRPENRDFLIHALRLYELIKNDVKIARCASQLARLLIKNGALDALNDLMSTLTCSHEYRLYVEEWCVVALIEYQNHQEALIRDYLTHLVHSFDRDSMLQNRLTLFFAKLSASSQKWYQEAYTLLKRDK